MSLYTNFQTPILNSPVRGRKPSSIPWINFTKKEKRSNMTLLHLFSPQGQCPIEFALSKILCPHTSYTPQQASLAAFTIEKMTTLQHPISLGHLGARHNKGHTSTNGWWPCWELNLQSLQTLPPDPIRWATASTESGGSVRNGKEKKHTVKLCRRPLPSILRQAAAILMCG